MEGNRHAPPCMSCVTAEGIFIFGSIHVVCWLVSRDMAGRGRGRRTRRICRAETGGDGDPKDLLEKTSTPHAPPCCARAFLCEPPFPSSNAHWHDAEMGVPTRLQAVVHPTPVTSSNMHADGIRALVRVPLLLLPLSSQQHVFPPLRLCPWTPRHTPPRRKCPCTLG